MLTIQCYTLTKVCHMALALSNEPAVRGCGSTDVIFPARRLLDYAHTIERYTLTKVCHIALSQRNEPCCE